MYVPGYKFKVSAKYDQGKIVRLPRIYPLKFVDRDPGVDYIEIEDDEELEVIRNDFGAIYVTVLRTGDCGYLG
jgi:hypothetical protein